MGRKPKRAIASIDVVFGTTARGFRLITYSDGQTIIDSHSWTCWSDVATTAGLSWADFAEAHAEELEAWSDEYLDGEAIRAWTLIDRADRWTILERFFDSLETSSAQALLDEIGSSRRALERLSQLARVSNSASGTTLGTTMTADEAIAGLQRVLDEEGLGSIRLVRDDNFLRMVYSTSDFEWGLQHGFLVRPRLLH